MDDQEPEQDFDRLLREAVEKQVDAEEAYGQAREAKPDEVMWSQRLYDLLQQARMERAARKGAGDE